MKEEETYIKKLGIRETGGHRPVSYRYYDISTGEESRTGKAVEDPATNLSDNEVFEIFHSASHQSKYQIIESIQEDGAVIKRLAEIVPEYPSYAKELNTYLHSFLSEDMKKIDFSDILNNTLFIPDTIISFQTHITNGGCYVGVLRSEKRPHNKPYRGIILYLGEIKT